MGVAHFDERHAHRCASLPVYKKDQSSIYFALAKTFLMVMHSTKTSIVCGGFLRGALSGSADAVLR